MKKFTVYIILFSFIFSLTAPALAATVTLVAGTTVRLDLVNTLNSNVAVVGEEISFKVIDDVRAEGKVVIKAGSIAFGEITMAVKNGAVGKPGTIGVTLKHVNAVDGTRVNLRATRVVSGESKQGAAIAVTVLCCVLGLLMKGDQAILQAGHMIDATTITTVEIDVNNIPNSNKFEFPSFPVVKKKDK